MMLRKFSTFSLESSFPKDTKVTVDNYYLYNWEVYDKEGSKFISMMYKSELCKSHVEAFVNGDEHQVKDALQSYLSNNYSRLNDIKSLL